MTVCICEWSIVTTVTEDPPHIIDLNPECPVHAVPEAVRDVRDDVMVGRCSYTQAMARLIELGASRWQAEATVAQWIGEMP